jgi:hypothetical protein
MLVVLDYPDITRLPIAKIGVAAVSRPVNQLLMLQYQHLCHFSRIGNKTGVRRNKADNRLHNKPDRADHSIKTTKHLYSITWHCNFLMRLTQGGVDQCPVHMFNLATRETDLPCMMRKMVGAFGHDDLPSVITDSQADKNG